jgi:hypothetical protein
MNKLRASKIAAALAAAAFFATPALAQGSYAAWSGHRTIALNTSATGANVTDTVYNFPVLVRLGEAEAAILAAANGGNSIRFSKADDVTALPFQIESWSPTAAAIWVKVDTVKGNNATQAIRMHYGNAAAAAESNGGAVFGTSNGYVGHWNLGNASGLSPRPSSVTGAPAAIVRNGLAPVSGIIGMADTLDPNGTANSSLPGGRYIEFGRDSTGNNNNYAGFTDFSTGFSYSGWFMPTSTIQFWRALVMAADSLGIVTADGNRTLIMGNRSNDGQISFRWHGASYNSGPGVFSVGEWRHVAISKAAGTSPVNIYVNGALFASTGSEANLPTLVRNGVWIGRSGINTDGYFSGKVDNISMTNAPRSAAWFKLSYANQITANLLTNIGNPVVATAPGVPTTVTAVAGNAQATVSWAAPVSNGGSVITGYKAMATSDTTKSCTTTGALTCVVTTLTNGSPYAFVVKATNAVGTGSTSAASDTVRPALLAGWTAGRSITLNTTATGANVAGTVRNFPVLIRLGSAEASIISAANGGASIRFLKADSATIIPHQIESWSPTAATIWVKVDSVLGNNNTQKIHMIWGNAGAVSTSNSAAVFDTANGYRGVFHMNDTSSNIVDATVNAVVGTNEGTTPVAGILGTSRNFAGTNAANTNSTTGRQFINLNNPAALNFTGKISMSAWVRWVNLVGTENASYYRTFINRDGSAPSSEVFLRIGQNAGNAEHAQYTFGKYTGSADVMAQSPQFAYEYGDSSQWTHIAGAYDSAGPTTRVWRLYRNGVQIAVSEDAAEAEVTGASTLWRLGRGPGTQNARWFVGDMDEVRIDAVTRDANYVKLSYENQKATNSLVDIGSFAVATVPGAPTSVNATVVTTVTGAVNVSWTAPTSNGGSAITGYTVTSNPGAKTCTAVAPAVTCQVSTLTAGTSTTFTVVATNVVGNSAASTASNAVSPVTSLLPGNFAIRMDGSKPYTYRLPTNAVALTEKLTMTITDVQGKTVWTRTINPSTSLIGEITWNGKSAKGLDVSAGMYIVNLRAVMGGQVIESINRGVKF